MVDSGTAIVAQGCHLCRGVDKLKDCIGCGFKVCAGHRGAGDDDYRNTKDQEGYACHACIEKGLAYEKGTFVAIQRLSSGVDRIGATAQEIKALLSTFDTKLLPVVMKEVDQRLKTIQAEIVNPTVTAVLDNLNKQLLPAVMKEVDQRLLVIQREIVTPTVNQVHERAEGLVNAGLKSTGKEIEAATDKLSNAIDGRVQNLTEAVERLNPTKLLWQAGLVFGLVNVATVIAAVWIAKHM